MMKKKKDIYTCDYEETWEGFTKMWKIHGLELIIQIVLHCLVQIMTNKQLCYCV